MTHRLFRVSAAAGTALLAALLLSVLAREDATLWNSLVDMSVLAPLRPRAVLHEATTALQGDLTTQMLDASGDPYLLRGTVRIPAGHRVDVRPGTTVLAAEGARLLVEGTLSAERASFASNQLHAARRFWHGLTAENGGRIELVQSSIAHASTALTCAGEGSVDARGVLFLENLVAVTSLPDHRTCTTDGATVNGGRTGFHLVGGSPRITNVRFDRVFDGVRVLHDARPNLANLDVRRLAHALVVYAVEPALVIRRATFLPGADRAALVIDGADAPTHRWNGEEFSTGLVHIE